jgi:restriction system protein
MVSTGVAERSSEVPTYEAIMLPLLQTAKDGAVHRVRDVVDAIAAYFSLPEELRRETLPDGCIRLVHRMEWARTYLKKAGLLEYPSRGQFRITKRGIDLLSEKPKKITNKILSRYPEFVEFKSSKPNDHARDEEVAQQVVDPEEALENGYQALRSEIENDLLNKVKSGSPDFFEQIVVDLLLKMGSGALERMQGGPLASQEMRASMGS